MNQNRTLQEVLGDLTLDDALRWRNHHYNVNYVIKVADIPSDAKFTARWVRRIEADLFARLAIHDQTVS